MLTVTNVEVLPIPLLPMINCTLATLMRCISIKARKAARASGQLERTLKQICRGLNLSHCRLYVYCIHVVHYTKNSLPTRQRKSPEEQPILDTTRL